MNCCAPASRARLTLFTLWPRTRLLCYCSSHCPARALQLEVLKGLWCGNMALQQRLPLALLLALVLCISSRNASGHRATLSGSVSANTPRLLQGGVPSSPLEPVRGHAAHAQHMRRTPTSGAVVKASARAAPTHAGLICASHVETRP